MGGGARIAQGCVPVAITVGFVSPDGALVKSLPRQKTFHSHAFLLQSPATPSHAAGNKRRTTLETLPHWAGHPDHDYITFPSMPACPSDATLPVARRSEVLYPLSYFDHKRRSL